MTSNSEKSINSPNNELNLDETLSFGFEQTFTIPDWWTDEGFTATSDTPLKREKMLRLAQEIAAELDGSFIESVDIWDHMQYETFDKAGNPSFVVTMDPGSIEVKTQPCLARDCEKMARPLFAAALRAEVVPFRNWWYGIQGGTEGGCHVNMGGFSPETNPLKLRPDLAVKYSAYIHNRPWLHYPFMGLDVGPEGNAMRMDEKPGLEKVKEAFAIYKSSAPKSADQVFKIFEKTNLISDKASFPSLYKLRAPLYLIEDRGQEALRSSEEFEMVAKLRLEILKKLQEDEEVEELQSFSQIHKQCLTSYWLWEKFQEWANQMGINPVPFQRFFDRQFPRLQGGDAPPTSFWLKEGRRPRVITDIVKKGDTIISKSIDTSYKRFELCFIPSEKIQGEKEEIKIIAEGIENQSPIFTHQGHLGFGETKAASYLYFDIKVSDKNPMLKIHYCGESACFDMNDMMWKASP